jgi:hypothetical protein
MKRFSIIFLLVFFSFSAVYGQVDLAKMLKCAGTAKDYEDSDYMKIFDTTSVKMMDSGLSHVTSKTFYKVLNTDGAKHLKAIILDYDPMSAYTEVKAATLVRRCGKTIPLDVKAVKDYPAPARAIYWGARQKILPVGKLYPGDGVYVETYRKGYTYALLRQKNTPGDERYIPPMKGHFYDIVPFYSDVPVLKKSYELSVPVTKKLQFEFYNGEARHWSHMEKDRIRYYWEKKDILPRKKENNMVSWSDVAPKLLMSTSPDWEAKALWFHKVNEDFGSFEYDDEIKRKTDEIIAGAKDDWEKISRLTHWVAEEIRYSGISMGEGEGFTLHKGTMTFLDRCGVCKDKAGMLVTMLRAAGFTSYPAMTMAGSRIDRIPADQFNHSVTVVKMDGQWHLLDPTWVPGVRELWSSAEQQQEYLMGIPGGADLMSTPISDPKNHYLKYNINSRIAKDGTLTANVEIRAEGQSDSNLRRRFTRRMLNQWDTVLQRELFDLSPLAQVSNVSYTDPIDLSNPFLLKFTIQIPAYAKQGKSGLYMTPLANNLPLNGLIFFQRMKTKEESKKYPFRTRSSQLVKVNETIKLPGKYKLANKPTFETVKGSGADFSGSLRMRGTTISIQKEIKLKKRIYQPADWDSFKKSVLEFKKPDGGVLILKGGAK